MVKFNLKENIPQKKCEDKNCPYHGQVKVRGRYFQGKVVSDKMYKTVTIEKHFLKYIPKYNRYTRKKTKIHAHNPECIDAKTGMTVLIGETRPLSKTKNFVVLKIISAEEFEQGLSSVATKDGAKDTVEKHTKKSKASVKVSQAKSTENSEPKEESKKEGADKKPSKKSNKE
jgi:small subunit ribosomal protein S17